MYGRFQGIGNSVVTSPRSSGSAELAFDGVRAIGDEPPRFVT